MKRFTFIATLLLAFAAMAQAEIQDKYFFKIPTDKNPGWYIQDGTNTTMTYGKDYLEVKQAKNAGRMLNYAFNEAAWGKTSLAEHPTYKYTMNLNFTSMATRSDFEFTLLPVNACNASATYPLGTHNTHWYDLKDVSGADSLGYFFRFRIITAPTEANGDFTIMINENPTARTNWPTTTNADSLCTLSSQKLYKFAVVIDTQAKTATYTIADEAGTVVKTGVHAIASAELRAGIVAFSTQGLSTMQVSNMGLSYEAEGPFAEDPSADLLAVVGTERDYYAQFAEGHTLHWIAPGQDEQTIAYADANDTREFTQDPENYFGSKILECYESGNLEFWTTLDENESESEHQTIAVTCEAITLPQPVATITNVSAGYGKTYTFTADNSSVLCTPTITIRATLPDGTTKDFASGETYTFEGAGTLTAYSCDATHPTAWYTQSDPITVDNKVEYVEYSTTNYAWEKAVCDGPVENFTKEEIVDPSNKSHWDRIYSDQKYGYDAAGNASVYVEGTDYPGGVKEGFGFYAGTAIGTDDAKWNVQAPNDIYTGFLPLVPAENTSYGTGNAGWEIFPLEGIVYYATNITYLTVNLASCYTSDDAEKPNFYIVHTRGGYDRPDKGDCNATTVVKAGESYSLYRYDTAICDVKIMTYKGFDPTTAINAVKGVANNEVAAPAVKKIMTANGFQIVKDGKKFNAAGAQMK